MFQTSVSGKEVQVGQRQDWGGCVPRGREGLGDTDDRCQLRQLRAHTRTSPTMSTAPLRASAVWQPPPPETSPKDFEPAGSITIHATVQAAPGRSPVMSTVSLKALTSVAASCPVIASTTSSVSVGFTAALTCTVRQPCWRWCVGLVCGAGVVLVCGAGVAGLVCGWCA